MPLEQIRIGVPTVDLGRENVSVSLPSFAGVTVLASAASEGTSGDFLFGDVQAPLTASATYQFVVAPMGFMSNLKGGYSIGRASAATGIVSPSAGQAIKLSIATGSLPANADQSIAMAVFVCKNSASTYQLQGFYYLPSGESFEALVGTDPISASPRFSLATLLAATVDPILGDRTPLAVVYDSLPTTEGGITVAADAETVQVRPDNSPNYTAVTARAENLQFAVLENDLKRTIAAGSGNYMKSTTIVGGNTLEIGQRTMITSSVIFKGNRPIRMQMPSDANGAGEIVVLLGNLTNNSASVSLQWKKDGTTPVQFNLQTAAQDRLLKHQHSVIAYRRY